MRGYRLYISSCIVAITSLKWVNGNIANLMHSISARQKIKNPTIIENSEKKVYSNFFFNSLAKI